MKAQKLTDGIRYWMARQRVGHREMGEVCWGIKENSATAKLLGTRSISPKEVEEAVMYLGIPPKAARRLHELGAIEAGWKIEKGEGQ